MILPVNGTCRDNVINWPNFDIAVSEGLRSLRTEMAGSTEQSGHTYISDGNVPMVPGTSKQLQY